jgi:hypothetical protein
MVRSIAIAALPLKAVEKGALNFHLRDNPAFRIHLNTQVKKILSFVSQSLS